MSFDKKQDFRLYSINPKKKPQVNTDLNSLLAPSISKVKKFKIFKGSDY